MPSMADYNNVQAGSTVLTFQQQNQQNILAAIAEGAPMTRLNALAYLLGKQPPHSHLRV